MKSYQKQYIFLVDDDMAILKTVGETLKKLGVSVTCFPGATDCLERLYKEECDLLIADVKMPEMNGMELLSECHRIAPWMPVLLITGYADIPMAFAAGRDGAVDFIEKPLNRESFIFKVNSLLQQNIFRDSLVGKPLTKVEMKVLELTAMGKTSKEIAQLLNRSARTIEVHRSHIRQKLCAGNFADLIKKAFAMKLIPLEKLT
jgi:FixJ family two-component response regulator